MTDRDNIISGLQFTVEMMLFDPLTGETKDSEQLNEQDKITYDACIGAIELLKEQEREKCSDEEFMISIVTSICDYAIDNDMEPDQTLSIVADNIKALLEISTFNGWKRR